MEEFENKRELKVLKVDDILSDNYKEVIMPLKEVLKKEKLSADYNAILNLMIHYRDHENENINTILEQIIMIERKIIDRVEGEIDKKHNR